MARTVSDLAYILPVVAGPDGKDSIVVKREIPSIDLVDPKKLKVYYYDSNGQGYASPDVRRAVNMAAGALKAEGLDVEYCRPKGVEKSVQIWQAGMGQAEEPFTKDLRPEGEEPISTGREFLRMIAGKSKITFPSLAISLTEGPNKLFKGMNKKSLEFGAVVRQRIEDMLGDNGVIICPVYSIPAPKHTWEAWSSFFRLGIGYSGIFNILEFPCTTLPIYHRGDGLPVSVQVVSSRWNDHLTLATAKILEDIFGGWKPPDKIG
jgi:Asp-tRNA(Asn)/Glu-tRNA(Gln) amidotransferase A subunit family amidase